MKILVTGAKGFVGRNLVENLKCIQDGRNKTRKISISEIYEVDLETSHEDLRKYCSECDFVFHLAGVNRPKDTTEFMSGNYGFSAVLLELLKEFNNTCPVMLSSSAQASLVGRYAGSEYGLSKLMGENLFFDYHAETGADVLVYRFPNLFGKWCRPNYNSAVATFCHNMAHDLEITVHDESVVLELLYIDDLIDEMLCALEGHPHRCDYDGLDYRSSDSGKFCVCPVTFKVSLGEIVSLLKSFKNQSTSLIMPELSGFAKRLYSTYLSYLPKEKVAIPLKMNCDHRGSFTEVLKTLNFGQFSVNVSKPGVTKGQHWHNTKWEFFVVVSGHGLIQQRKIGTDEVIEFEVSGEKIEALHMLPGYTHNIINLSETENMVTLMWANELFDANHPDTFFEEV